MLFLIIFILFWAASAAILTFYFTHIVWAAILVLITAGLTFLILGLKIVYFFTENPFYNQVYEQAADLDIKEVFEDEGEYYAIFGSNNITFWIPTTKEDIELNGDRVLPSKKGDKDFVRATIFIPKNPIINVLFKPFFFSTLEFTFTEENYNKLFKEEITNE